MSVDVPDRIKALWFLPTPGDRRCHGAAAFGRAVDPPHLTQAADALGLRGVLPPVGRSCPRRDPALLVAAVLRGERDGIDGRRRLVSAPMGCFLKESSCPV